MPVKVSPQVSLGPTLRGYAQRGSRYFQPFAQHELDAEFYTSDYDLSTFTSYQVGLDVRYTSLQAYKKGGTLSEMGLSYRYYRRSDGLYYHTVSLLFDFGFEKVKKRK